MSIKLSLSPIYPRYTINHDLSIYLSTQTTDLLTDKQYRKALTHLARSGSY